MTRLGHDTLPSSPTAFKPSSLPSSTATSRSSSSASTSSRVLRSKALSASASFKRIVLNPSTRLFSSRSTRSLKSLPWEEQLRSLTTDQMSDVLAEILSMAAEDWIPQYLFDFIVRPQGRSFQDIMELLPLTSQKILKSLLTSVDILADISSREQQKQRDPSASINANTCPLTHARQGLIKRFASLVFRIDDSMAFFVNSSAIKGTMIPVELYHGLDMGVFMDQYSAPQSVQDKATFVTLLIERAFENLVYAFNEDQQTTRNVFLPDEDRATDWPFCELLVDDLVADHQLNRPSLPLPPWRLNRPSLTPSKRCMKPTKDTAKVQAVTRVVTDTHQSNNSSSTTRGLLTNDANRGLEQPLHFQSLIRCSSEPKCGHPKTRIDGQATSSGSLLTVSGMLSLLRSDSCGPAMATTATMFKEETVSIDQSQSAPDTARILAPLTSAQSARNSLRLSESTKLHDGEKTRTILHRTSQFSPSVQTTSNSLPGKIMDNSACWEEANGTSLNMETQTKLFSTASVSISKTSRSVGSEATTTPLATLSSHTPHPPISMQSDLNTRKKLNRKSKSFEQSKHPHCDITPRSTSRGTATIPKAETTAATAGLDAPSSPRSKVATKLYTPPLMACSSWMPLSLAPVELVDDLFLPSHGNFSETLIPPMFYSTPTSPRNGAPCSDVSKYQTHPMKRAYSGISLKRPTARALPVSQQLNTDSQIQDSSQLSPLATPFPLLTPNATIQTCTSAPHVDLTKDVLTTAASTPAIAVSLEPFSTTRRPILKPPGSKSPIQKKVEFVNDSEDGSLSDPDYEDDDDADFYGRSTKAIETTRDIEIVIPTPRPNSTSNEQSEITHDYRDYEDNDKLIKGPTVSKDSILMTSITPDDMQSKVVEAQTTRPTTITVKPGPRITYVESGSGDEEAEDDYVGEDGDSCSDMDYDSDVGSIKKRKTGRATHETTKPINHKTSSRNTRPGRPPLVPIKLTISSKPFPTSKPNQHVGKSLATLGKRFKVPSFTVPGMAPDPTTRPTTLTLGVKRRAPVEGRSAHDYTLEGSIILYDPAWAQLDEAQKEEERLLSASQGKDNGEDQTPQVIIPKKEKAQSKSIAEMLGLSKRKEQPKVHVVVDPVLGRILRPHQVEGVKFMYKCTSGMVQPNAFGCIMADEMGLGKTLQCLTLLWTLLKQSPEAGKGAIEKCIICCPSSLVRNWANEIIKWLGAGKIGVLTCDAKGTKEETNNAMKQWASAKQRMVVNPVLIISYESLRMYAPVLAQTPIGLMLCDEGHRLKNSGSQTFVELNKLNVQRRVILSGTPIQNDLSEYFSLLNFANPGLLGSTAEFRKNYELPILRGRDSEASAEEQEVSNQKLAELSSVVSKFIIRRTNDILSKYLPTKFEHVVFCNLSQLQLDLYNHFINSKSIQKLLRGNGSQPLKAIGLLKKLCNHPDLLNLPNDLEGCEKLLPPDYQIKSAKKPLSRGGVLVQTEFSGKMMVLERMLAKIKKETTDKIVLISNYTQTLDIFEKLCRQKQYGVLRLDGTMTINKRQKLVDRFNDPEGLEFVFLLSSKAGGCGLNLIGANRLILFDPDWNPAADQQALARVWRDGQKKDCFVYRFIATGSIEEKIFQRQSHKQSLSSCVVDEDQDVERHFSQENLRQLFQFNATTDTCDTHETFKCKRCIKGRQIEKAAQVSYGDTSTWNHFMGDRDLLKLPDPLLKAEANTKAVSFVFQYISH
ncbi:DNA-dependent ATPase protein rad54 [Podila epigama]|nr:DNA-dependent ATPase protein rad54 [Podila epigama]